MWLEKPITVKRSKDTEFRRKYKQFTRQREYILFVICKQRNGVKCVTRFVLDIPPQVVITSGKRHKCLYRRRLHGGQGEKYLTNNNKPYCIHIGAIMSRRKCYLCIRLSREESAGECVTLSL